MTPGRFVVWRGLDGWRSEACHVTRGTGGWDARGTQVGTDPLPYRLDYALDTADDWTTRRMGVAATGAGWARRLVLSRGDDGRWACVTHTDGEVDLPASGGPTDGLAGARDCDLGLSPLTNTPPVRRAGLHRADGATETTVAWISVPDLAVRADRQRYEHVAPGRVRFTDLGLFPGFTADLELDEDALVVRYPGLAVMAGPGGPV